MSRNQFIIEQIANAKLTIEHIARWFCSQDYQMVDFEEGTFKLLSYYGGTSIYHKLKERKGYKTFIKEGFGGSLLVFEIEVKFNKITIESYAPIQLFGFIPLELAFKEKASWITQYRKHGYETMVHFKQFIHASINQKKLIK